MNVKFSLINILIVIFSILFPTFSILAQVGKTEKSIQKSIPISSAPLAKVSCDCKDAIEIKIQKVTKYGLTVPPNGFGEQQEINQSKNSGKYFFEKEHNSAWYFLNIISDGDLVFEIVPKDSADDYDFMLFQHIDSNFCNSILKNKEKPIRSNISRCDMIQKGKTGLAKDSEKELVGEGVGVNNSKFISVKKGEKYMLVIDNVYPNGNGHTIYFNYIKSIEINGLVVDEANNPIIAEIALTDDKGNVVKELTTDNDGKYSITTNLKENVNYNLSFISDSTFLQTKKINTKDLKGISKFTDIRTVLPQLKKGKKYIVGNINFYGNAAKLMPESMPSVDALIKLMKRNKDMVIQIEGHVNGGNSGVGQNEPEFRQKLSENRALTIYDLLIKNGINATRITTIGHSDKKMLFPKPKNLEEEQANRRVEINVISIR